MLRGIDVVLTTKTVMGTDAFGSAIYGEDTVETVKNVLIGEPTADEIAEAQAYGETLAYTLAIPKGDAHHWTDGKVTFWGETFKVIGEPTQGIESLIPLRWNRKVRVKRWKG